MFVVRRRIVDMSHVDGNDDGVGYGVSDVSFSRRGVGVLGLSDRSTGGYGQSNNSIQ
jgi:hypothetical protein